MTARLIISLLSFFVLPTSVKQQTDSPTKIQLLTNTLKTIQNQKSWQTDNNLKQDSQSPLFLQQDPNCIRTNKDKEYCLECIEGWGPYFEGEKNSTCRKCTDLRPQDKLIPNCKKCMWVYIKRAFNRFTIDYQCMNCTEGMYPLKAKRVTAPEHHGKVCTKCPINCKDCLMDNFCLSCSSERETYKPGTASKFENVQFCQYQMWAKASYAGVFIAFSILTWVLLSLFCCSDMKAIQTQFFMANVSAKNYVNISELMSVKEPQWNSEGYVPQTGGFDPSAVRKGFRVGPDDGDLIATKAVGQADFQE